MTGLVLKIESKKIAELLSIQFYIERENAITIYKDDLIRVYKADGVEYYAPVKADRLGRGHLIARAEFADKEIMYPGSFRPVVVSGFTGYTIPCMGEGNTISCGEYEISFEKVSDIPKNEGTKVYVGSVKKWVIGYEYITEDMIKSLAQREVGVFQDVLPVEAGDRFVIAIPKDWNLEAYKDNGFGGEAPFSTTIMGANGMELKINDISYKIYGEFITVGGNIKIYIE